MLILIGAPSLAMYSSVIHKQNYTLAKTIAQLNLRSADQIILLNQPRS